MTYRIRDFMMALVIISLLFPLFIAVGAVLLLTGEGELFYKQQRVGKDRKIFNIYKFSTMLKDSPNMGAGTLTMRDDPRVLPFGKILRKTKINELPQLLNIIIGNMSLVGPRPLVPSGDSLYSEKDARVIRSVVPGLTGLGSLMLRDEEKYYGHRDDAEALYTDVIAPYKANLEVWYVLNKTFLLDAKIIFATALSLFFPRLEMDRFFPLAPQPPENLRNEIKGSADE
jgi:lipopolysaccharide/colanic/teichoic acid biosynthesis glycosyltransferase